MSYTNSLAKRCTWLGVNVHPVQKIARVLMPEMMSDALHQSPYNSQGRDHAASNRQQASLGDAIKAHTEAKNMRHAEKMMQRREQTARDTFGPLGAYLGSQGGRLVSHLAGERPRSGLMGYLGFTEPRIDPTEAKELGGVLGGALTKELAAKMTRRLSQDPNASAILNELNM